MKIDLERRGARYAPGSKPRLSSRFNYWLTDKLDRIGAWLGLAAVAVVGLWFTYLLIGP